jgi:hypothetical protein
VPRTSCFAADFATMFSIASDDMRRSSGTRTSRAAHRPEVDGREGRGRRRPGQEPVARLQPESAQAPCRQAASPVELAEAPVPGRAVVGAEPYRVPIAEARDGRFEQVEERVHSRERSVSPSPAAGATAMPVR